ncbi:amino acid permease [Flavobacteriaceae bacterium KMM 6897]|nr:amino acid permease [Flavobacteriaceae bacterium KMM 6897]
MAKPVEIKKIGLWTSTSLVIGNMIGAGVFLMPAALASFGGISTIGWLFSAFGALLLARVFSKLSVLVANKSGGPYAFTKAAFGDFAGFLVAWGYWISVWTSNAAIAIAFVSALSVFFPILDENPIVAVLVGLSAIWGLTALNSRGVRASGKMQLITTILKLSPLFIVILCGFFFFNPENFYPFNISGKSNFSAIAITATMTLYAFLGIESATVPSGNVKDPKKTIPRATMIGTSITTVVYLLGTVVVMGMIPANILAESPAPFADAMEIMSGEWGRDLVGAGAVIAAFGALNGWILIQGQVAMATAKDDLFPRIFKRENKHGAPVLGMVIGSFLTSVVMLLNFSDGLVEQFKFIVLLATLCCLIPYLFSTAAYVLLVLQEKLAFKNTVGVIALGGMAFLFSLWAIFGAGEPAVFYGFILLMAGIPFYVLMKVRSKKKD